MAAPSILHEMKPFVDRTIEGLRKVQFKSDPIVEKEFSRIYSLVGSSQKRHGGVIEKSIIEALKKYPQYQVWNEQAFKISRRVNAMLANVNNVKNKPDWYEFLGNNFDYGDSERTQQVDVIAYDRDRKIIIGMEVKRGYSHHDAGKKKKILHEILATRMLIKSYGVSQGLDVDEGTAFVCSYYGANEFDSRVEISKDGLNDLFQVDIYSSVEEVNHYFRTKIREMGAEWVASIK